MATTRFDKIVKVIRIDNALDLGLNNEATQFFVEKGIQHQTTCVSTPQQSGVIQRKYRHLFGTCRALLSSLVCL